MRTRSKLLAACCLTAATGTASAQAAGTVEVSALGVWHNKTTTLDGLGAVGAGARLGIWLPMRFELEGQVDVTSLRQKGSGASLQLVHFAGSLGYNIPVGRGSTYLRGGYGKLRPNCVIGVAAYCYSHGAIVAAAGFRAPLTAGLQLRAEAMMRNRSAYQYTSFGASLGFTFLTSTGGRSRSESGPDSDGDGISNRRDRCADTPRGALTDGRGCPSDFDGDGVFDGIDRCPSTPKGTSVDPIGCPVKKPD